MNQPPRRATAARASSESETGRLSPAATRALAILVPGAGHAAQGHPRKAAVFFVVLVFMFVIGLSFGGRLFPFLLADPLVFLAACAEWSIGMPRLIAAVAGLGAGDVVAVTYEYGNTFLIAAGLLNLLVVLDAGDLASGRKT